MTIPVPRLRYTIGISGVVLGLSHGLTALTIPYVTRSLGAESYGQAMYVLTIINYFQIAVDYGFVVSASKAIAANRHNIKQVQKIYINTCAAQFLLAAISFAALLVVIALLEHWQQFFWLLLLGYGSIFVGLFGPFWLWQGLEQQAWYGPLFLLAKTASLLWILIFVKDHSDMAWYVATPIVANAIVSFATLYWAYAKLKIRWDPPRVHEIKTAFLEGKELFITRLLIGCYTTLVAIIAGHLLSPTMFASFVLADRLRNIAGSTLSIFWTGFFPRICHLVVINPFEAWQLGLRSLKITLMISLCICVGIWIAADFLVAFFGGQEFVQAASVLRWLAPAIVVANAANVISNQILIPFGLQRELLLSLLSTAMIALATLYPLTKAYGVMGVVLTILLSETWSVVVMFFFILRIKTRINSAKQL